MSTWTETALGWKAADGREIIRGAGREHWIACWPESGIKARIVPSDERKAKIAAAHLMLECVCGAPLYPAQTCPCVLGDVEEGCGCEGTYMTHTHPAPPRTCSSCGRETVLCLVTDAAVVPYVFTGIARSHDCRCDPAGDFHCPSAIVHDDHEHPDHRWYAGAAEV